MTIFPKLLQKNLIWNNVRKSFMAYTVYMYIYSFGKFSDVQLSKIHQQFMYLQLMTWSLHVHINLFN